MIIDTTALKAKVTSLETTEFNNLGRNSVDGDAINRFHSRLTNRMSLIETVIKLAKLVKVDKLNQIEYDI